MNQKDKRTFLIVGAIGVGAYLLFKKKEDAPAAADGGTTNNITIDPATGEVKYLDGGQTNTVQPYIPPAPVDLSAGATTYDISTDRGYLLKTAGSDQGLINAYNNMSPSELKYFKLFITDFVMQGRQLSMFGSGQNIMMFPVVKSLMTKYPVLKSKYGTLIKL